MNQLPNPYPGRIILGGRTMEGNVAAIYAITGRSEPSKARKLSFKEKEKSIYVVPTDEIAIEQGDLDLLLYPTMWWGKGIIVSNGKQTETIIEKTKKNYPGDKILKEGIAGWSYEPDAPHYTPRISMYIDDNYAESMFASIRRKSDGYEQRDFFTAALEFGKLKYISTYQGENINPLPSFTGEPREINCSSLSALALCNEIANALSIDYFVAAAAVMFNIKLNIFEHYILNK